MADHLNFYWSAFWELHSERPVGMGVGPIPFSAVARYADHYGVAGVDLFESFLDVVRAMDAAYLKWAGDRQSSKKTKP